MLIWCLEYTAKWLPPLLLANTSRISHNYHFFVVTTFKIYSISNLQVYNTVLLTIITILYIQFSSVTQSCPTLCDPMNCSPPGLPVHHKLPEFTQTHAQQVGDAIQPSHPLSSPSPHAPNPSKHQGLFQWVNSSHEVAKVLEFQLQHQSFQWTPRTDLLPDGLVGVPRTYLELDICTLWSILLVFKVLPHGFVWYSQISIY